MLRSTEVLSALMFSATICFTGLPSFAQTDAKAKSLLDELSAKTKGYTAMKADFNYLLDNNAEDIHETQSGSISIKGDKYFLKIAGQEVRCNGKTIWTYLKDAGEVQVTEVDPANKAAITPTNIFTIYEKGFRHKFVSEETSGGVTTAEVHIFPTDVDEKPYHTIKLYINKTKMELSRIVIMGKEGETYTYKIKSFIPNAQIPDEEFTYNAKAHPDVEVIDLR